MPSPSESRTGTRTSSVAERQRRVRRVDRQRQLLRAAVVRRLEVVGAGAAARSAGSPEAGGAVADPAAGRAVVVQHRAGDAVAVRVDHRHAHVERAERQRRVRRVDRERLLLRAAVPRRLEGVGAGVQVQVHGAVAAGRLRRLPAAARAVVGDLRPGDRPTVGVDERHRRRHRRGAGGGGQPGQDQQGQGSAGQRPARRGRAGRGASVAVGRRTGRTSSHLTHRHRVLVHLVQATVCNRRGSRVVQGTRRFRRYGARGWRGAAGAAGPGGKRGPDPAAPASWRPHRRTLIVFGVLVLLAVGGLRGGQALGRPRRPPPSGRAPPTRPSARSARSWPRRAPTCAASSASSRPPAPSTTSPSSHSPPSRTRRSTPSRGRPA